MPHPLVGEGRLPLLEADELVLPRDPAALLEAEPDAVEQRIDAAGSGAARSSAAARATDARPSASAARRKPGRGAARPPDACSVIAKPPSLPAVRVAGPEHLSYRATEVHGGRGRCQVKAGNQAIATGALASGRAAPGRHRADRHRRHADPARAAAGRGLCRAGAAGRGRVQGGADHRSARRAGAITSRGCGRSTGVVGENGAFWFRYDPRAAPAGATIPGRRGHAPGQPGQARRARRAHPGRGAAGCALASDQLYREADLAIDFCEDVPPLARRRRSPGSSACSRRPAAPPRSARSTSTAGSASTTSSP